MRNSLENIGARDNLLNRTSVPQALRSTMHKWDFMKLQYFCKAKDTVNWSNRQPPYWERVFAKTTFDRGLISKILNNSISYTPTIQITQLKNQAQS